MNYIDSVVKISICCNSHILCITLVNSCKIKCNEIQANVCSQNTHAYGTRTSRTHILSAVHLKAQWQLSWKTKFHLHKQWDYYSEIKAMADSVSGSKAKHFLTLPCYRPSSGRVGDKNAYGNLIAPRSIWNSAQAGCMQVAWRLLPREL